MIKRKSIRKICLGAFCLLILLLVYLFPKSNNNSIITTQTSYTITNMQDTIYLLDKNNYVSRINVSLSSKDTLDKALEMISYITENSSYKDVIPNGFKQIIPAGTKVLAYDLTDSNFKVNFSKEILSIKEELEMSLVEALTYTLTSIQEINSITILVEGELLTKLPHSHEFLPNPIDRSYGINKKYDIENLKGTTKTTLYYLSKHDGFYYYVPVTKVSNDSSEKIEIIIKELSSSPLYETSLMSYLNSETTLQNYELLDKELNLDFNNAILSDVTNNEILEEVTYAINLSVKDNYDVDAVMYSVENNKIATFDLKSLE